MKKSTKNPIDKIVRRLLTRQVRPVFSLIRRFRYRMVYGVYRYLPRSIRSSMPSLGKAARDYARQKLEERRARTKQIEPQTEQLEPQPNRDRFLPRTSTNYDRYNCRSRDPLTCISATQSGENDLQTRHCLQCGFPAALLAGNEIIGQRGRYRIISYLGSRGRGRIYLGMQVDNDRLVTIKEYLLPHRHFNHEEKRHIHNAFKNQGTIGFIDGQKDFRLLIDADVISPPPQEKFRETTRDPERCYLVTQGDRDRLTTLRSYLSERGAMSAAEVCQVLNLVLQSLESLHNQKFRLPTGKINSQIAHGNLSLESILIAVDSRPYLEPAQFKIYLTDLALWENLFIPPPRTPQIYSTDRDLIALGYVGFYLLMGRTVDENGYPLSPYDRLYWANIDPKLQQYIYRLLEIETPFKNAFTARQTLLKLQLKSAPPAPLTIPEVSQSDRQRKLPWRSLLVLFLALLLGGLSYWWWQLQRPSRMAIAQEPAICCISDLAGIPQGTFEYTAERNGIWHYVWQQKNLILKNISLKTKLAAKTPEFELKYRPLDSEAAAIESITSKQADFAVVSSVNDLNNNLTAETFAYDGLVFFIAFSQDRHSQDLLNSLDGKISLEQLQQLYTGQITNWQQLGAADLPVKLYAPDSDSAIALFEEQVLSDRGQVTTFRSLLSEDNLTGSITRLPILPMLRQILPEFENERVASIGFGSLARVFNQCSVYPLAIVNEDGNAIQPLIQSNLEPINPQLDLCKEKGSYLRDRSAFQTNRYPLTYPLAVVYPRDNSLTPAGKKFAEILKTDEAQELLGKTGLIPLD
ncbi:substrate-binding domain-containing protein [Pleurocapsales cyanobacterium LEGE 10410]|nr:substrate-binding domain-containing protein [Pleurocapsales cyanobacterium LEGE 10410]